MLEPHRTNAAEKITAAMLAIADAHHSLQAAQAEPKNHQRIYAITKALLDVGTKLESAKHK
jgi:hypothetical protein